MVAYLISVGADVNAANVFGETPLFFAIGPGGNSVPVLRLLHHHGATATDASDYDSSPLHAAAYEGDVGAVMYLLSVGYDAEGVTKNRVSAMLCAALSDEVDTHIILSALIAAGASIDFEDWVIMPGSRKVLLAAKRAKSIQGLF